MMRKLIFLLAKAVWMLIKTPYLIYQLGIVYYCDSCNTEMQKEEYNYKALKDKNKHCCKWCNAKGRCKWD